MRSRPASAVSTTTSSTSASSRSSSAVRTTLAAARASTASSAASSPWRTRPRAYSSEALVASSRQARPRARHQAPVSSRVTVEQRADEVARARLHPEQRAAPGRRGQPVEHGLGLVGGGVADRHEPAAGLGGRRRVAHVAGPRLQVARGVLGPRRAVHRERDPEALAQRAAVRLVVVGLRAQAVVDVQRARRSSPARRRRRAGRPSRARPTAARRRRLPGASRPVARTRSSSSSAIVARRPRDEQLGGVAEALQAHLADALELEVAPGERRPRGA